MKKYQRAALNESETWIYKYLRKRYGMPLQKDLDRVTSKIGADANAVRSFCLRLLENANDLFMMEKIEKLFRHNPVSKDSEDMDI